MENRIRYNAVPIDTVSPYATASAVSDLTKSQTTLKNDDVFLKLENREFLSMHYTTDASEIVFQAKKLSMT